MGHVLSHNNTQHDELYKLNTKISSTAMLPVHFPVPQDLAGQYTKINATAVSTVRSHFMPGTCF